MKLIQALAVKALADMEQTLPGKMAPDSHDQNDAIDASCRRIDPCSMAAVSNASQVLHPPIP